MNIDKMLEKLEQIESLYCKHPESSNLANPIWLLREILLAGKEPTDWKGESIGLLIGASARNDVKIESLERRVAELTKKYNDYMHDGDSKEYMVKEKDAPAVENYSICSRHHPSQIDKDCPMCNAMVKPEAKAVEQETFYHSGKMKFMPVKPEDNPDDQTMKESAEVWNKAEKDNCNCHSGANDNCPMHGDFPKAEKATGDTNLRPQGFKPLPATPLADGFTKEENDLIQKMRKKKYTPTPLAEEQTLEEIFASFVNNEWGILITEEDAKKAIKLVRSHSKDKILISRQVAEEYLESRNWVNSSNIIPTEKLWNELRKALGAERGEEI